MIVAYVEAKNQIHLTIHYAYDSMVAFVDLRTIHLRVNRTLLPRKGKAMRKPFVLFILSVVGALVSSRFAAQAPTHQVYLEDGTVGTQVDFTPWVAATVIFLATAAVNGWVLWQKLRIGVRLDMARSRHLPGR